MVDSSYKKQKVCIVEDEPNIREIYEIALEEHGYEVVTAEDGEQGLEVIKKEKPNIVLIDIIMPKLDGVDLMKILSKDENLSKIPVVVLTNLNDEKTLKRLKGLQSEFYLEKALVKPQGVVRIVREVLHHRS